MRWKSKDVSRWHSWFAWKPVTFTGSNTVVWLERVERRLMPYALFDWRWEYRYPAISSAALKVRKALR